jgi:hypothetical protein
MQELTGLRLAPAAKPDRVQARIRLDRGDTARFERPSFPTGYRPRTRLGAVDLGRGRFGVALGTLEGRTEVVLAMKSLPGWTSVYTLNPVLPASFLRALARHAGVHVYNDQDDTLYASRSFPPGGRAVIDMHIPDWDPKFLSEFDADRYVEALVQSRAQSIVCYAHSHVGLFNYPTKVGRQHAGLERPRHRGRDD